MRLAIIITVLVAYVCAVMWLADYLTSGPKDDRPDIEVRIRHHE